MKILERMVYPGRIIIIGADASAAAEVVVYAVTGRSPASQARKLELSGSAVWTKPTDPETVKSGNVDLLVYPAVILGSGVAVSNGRQTSDLDLSGGEGPAGVLAKSLERWTYEPDAPIYTPRITGCVLPDRRAGLSLIRRGQDGISERCFFEFSSRPGEGRLIATYAGENIQPLPIFRGEPLELELSGRTAAETAGAVYAALRPEGRLEDFRVAVACVFWPREAGLRPEVAILNRHERTSR